MTSPATLAEHLAANIPALAALETAGRAYRDIHNTIPAIERAINRPVEPKYCGNCPTLVQNKTGDPHPCAVPLYAPWDHHTQQYPAEIQCWKCKTTHQIEQLINHALSDVHDWLWTANEILIVMDQIGEGIPTRTWRRWRATGKIQSRNEYGAEPKYYLEEVRALRAKNT